MEVCNKDFEQSSIGTELKDGEKRREHSGT